MFTYSGISLLVNNVIVKQHKPSKKTKKTTTTDQTVAGLLQHYTTSCFDMHPIFPPDTQTDSVYVNTSPKSTLECV